MRTLLVLIALAVTLLHAEHVRWYGSYEKAYQEAVKEKKLLMVLLTKEACPASQKMLRTTFKDQPYIRSVNERFVSVIVTKGQKESYPIELLYTMSYPSLFFLNSEELFAGDTLFGYIDPETFARYLASESLHLELLR